MIDLFDLIELDSEGLPVNGSRGYFEDHAFFDKANRLIVCEQDGSIELPHRAEFELSEWTWLGHVFAFGTRRMAVGSKGLNLELSEAWDGRLIPRLSGGLGSDEIRGKWADAYGNWQMFGLTGTPTSLKTYWNGQLRNEFQHDASLSNNLPFLFGAKGDKSSPWQGAMYNYVLIDAALSDEAIAAEYERVDHDLIWATNPLRHLSAENNPANLGHGTSRNSFAVRPERNHRLRLDDTSDYMILPKRF